MDPAIERALGHGHPIDLTTTGRRSGLPRRIEITFHNLDGRIYISGMPIEGRTRAWLLNLRAEPRLTVHLKRPVSADLAATALEISDPEERRRVLERIARIWRADPHRMMAFSPLVEVTIDGYGATAAA